ncbi:hypothetical protein [Halobacterium yunchengense]|uniref:hypothetical protein n=1 Tax=Halobacterium yunchengense TaxID=3108497 RepID=UPI00300B0A30
MPSASDVDRPAEAAAVAQRYLRRERPLSGLVAALVVGVFLAAVLAWSLLPAVVVGAALVGAVRAPVLRPHGTVRVRCDDDPEMVRAAFMGATPPVLGFQWGIADEIRAEDDPVRYVTTYLFGLRTAEVAVESHSEPTAAGGCRVGLDVATNGRQWGSYAATIREDGDETVVDVEYGSDRHFGLRRLPQQLLAHRYRDDLLEAQGYAVVGRDSHLR